ncbi:MAG: oxygen-dependent tRNA uridine(34) hydroxylase TrhO [Mycetocola sp.]
MSVTKILLYYAFTPFADPESIRLWQRELATRHGLRGRIIISPDGINGTVGGEITAVKRYLRGTREYPALRDMDVKWSDGSGLDADGQSLDFPKLSVKVRDELVAFGAPGELAVDDGGVVGGGTHLTPEEVNSLVAERGDDVVFFDGRNAFEAELGRFRGAIVPPVETTRDFVEVLDSGVYDHLKGRPIVTYCTGGVRCEVLSGLMSSRGFGEVYQLSGGIVRYAEQYGDRELWEGSLYVFDKRGSLSYSDAPAQLAQCVTCGTSTGTLVNCSDPSCRVQLAVCDDHRSVHCHQHSAQPATA